MKVRALVFHGNRNDQSGLAIMGALAIGHVAFQAMAAERDRGPLDGKVRSQTARETALPTSAL